MYDNITYMERSLRNMEKTSKKERIKSIDKVLNLLELLSMNEHEMGIAEIGKQLNMGLSTVRRILTTLGTRGYIIKNKKTKNYRLGIKLFELGFKVQSTKHLIRSTRPYLRKLSKITNETANLAILEGKEVIYLDTVRSSEVLKTEIIPGTRTPAHCTALGKVLFAYLPRSEFNYLFNMNEKLVSLTSNSISSLDELKDILKEVKKKGYAIDKEEYKLGINCMGVPVFDKERKAIAAISTTGPASRFTIDKMEKAKEILISISKEVSNSFYIM